MKDGKVCNGKRIEWTGAGGDYFLAIVVDQDEVVAERWGNRGEILAWMEASWPELPQKYVPMVYAPRQRRAPKSPPPLRSKSHHAA